MSNRWGGQYRIVRITLNDNSRQYIVEYFGSATGSGAQDWCQVTLGDLRTGAQSFFQDQASAEIVLDKFWGSKEKCREVVAA